jgi:hypothetical protein
MGIIEHTQNCPVCNQQAKIKSASSGDDSSEIECLRCLKFSISGTLLATLDNYDSEERSKISHFLAKAFYCYKKENKLNTENIKSIINNYPLPNPQEKVDNFIKYLAKEDGICNYVTIIFDNHKNNNPYLESIIGLKIPKDNIIDELILINFLKEYSDLPFFRIKFSDNNITTIDNEIRYTNSLRIKLAFKGWEYYQELTKNNKNSKKVFLAMAFDEKNSFFYKNENYLNFQREIKKLGFDLFHVGDAKKAKTGNITDRIKVEIRESKFLIEIYLMEIKGHIGKLVLLQG